MKLLLFCFEFGRASGNAGYNLCSFAIVFEGSVALCPAIMAAWGHPGMAAVPAEITEEKLQEKGKRVCYNIREFLTSSSRSDGNMLCNSGDL